MNYLFLLFSIFFYGLLMYTEGDNTFFYKDKRTNSIEKDIKEQIERLKFFNSHVDGFDKINVLRRNSPFLFSPSFGCKKEKIKSIILVHSLGTSPYILTSLARFLRSKCFWVYGLLLKGHGTTYEDLSKTVVTDWEEQLYLSFEKIKHLSEKVYLLGMGIGANLVLNLFLENTSSIYGLILVEPRLFLDELENLKFKTTVSSVNSSKEKKFAEIIYPFLPKNSLTSYTLLVDKLGEKIWHQDRKNIDKPILIFLNDSYLLKKKMVLIDKLFKKPEFIVFYSKDKPIIKLDNNPGVRISFLNTYSIKKRHLHLPYHFMFISHSNELCGHDSQYIDCSHYLFNKEKYNKCLENDVWWGDPSVKNVNYIIRTMTYNPHYMKTLIIIDNFLREFKKYE